MSPLERSEVIATVLTEISEALNQGAAGPTDYWFKKLSERLVARAQKVVDDVRRPL